ncbi:MAG: rod shape-determining protein MreC [Oscillospiraceae bacterium]|nr:rod shape-determining protein MreC [Oscillospiraceae bacterium]
MRHFFSTRVRVILIVSLLIAALLGVVSGVTGQNIPSMLVQTALTPLRSGANAVMQQAEQIYDYLFRFEQLKAENAALRQQIAKMQEDALEADALRKENERLRQLLGLQMELETFDQVDAYIIARSSASEWVSTLTINRGSNAGIAVGMCAITESGAVVGLVSEVGPNYAVVKTVLDSSLQISATISENGYAGMVSGGYTSGHSDLLRMDYLPSAAVIRNNDQVVTSGSTVYPRNLILGYVVDAGFEDSGVAKYAILRPAANIDELEQIFIITNYEAK